jgi:hypothetical protein
MNPDKTPSYEDMVRLLGEDKMGFMSEMLQPDPPQVGEEEEEEE